MVIKNKKKNIINFFSFNLVFKTKNKNNETPTNIHFPFWCSFLILNPVLSSRIQVDVLKKTNISPLSLYIGKAPEAGESTPMSQEQATKCQRYCYHK